ncbi:CAP domain-containing protein [Anaeroselena agilis]|uniref:CAP domain-containing protein n=1 Tax=Anaeroselena agilis TaxID=3063788 RepID=A0ABU3NYM7_9FIRM|nr:CAP domain-containing protein [Selenomonadales bacterium 4137-cl]
MIKQILKNKLVPLLLTVTLLTTSFGGAFALPAAAADGAAVRDGASDNSILAAVVAVGLIAALAGGGSSDSGVAPSKGTGTDVGSGSGSNPSGGTSTASEEQQALALLNQDRAANGLPALKANTQLTQLARNYAQDMIARGFFSHYNPEGQSPFDRMQQAGISYKYAGENLAVNSGIAAAEVAFMNSSGHRANILSPNFTEVGIGVARNTRGQVYVVQEFIGR